MKVLVYVAWLAVVTTASLSASSKPCRKAQYNDAIELSGNFTKCVMENATPVTYCQLCDAVYKTVTAKLDALPPACNESIPISETTSYIHGVWDSSHCDDCSKTEYETSDELARDFFNCTHIVKNNTLVCHVCESFYSNFLEYYSERSEACQANAQFADTVTNVQRVWSDKQCDIPRHNQPPLIVALTLLCILPVLFYPIGYAISRRQAKKAALY